MIGETLGNYRIVAKLGKGGMGAVYLAEHEVIGRKAAIKVLLPEFSHRPAVVNRLFNEARATAKLQHPALVQIYDCGRHEATGSAYLVMDYLEGESLGRRISRLGRLPVGTAVEYARQIAGGMAVAHQAGIIHRDLKPDNIFLVAHAAADADVVRILDFGIAKLCDLGPDRVGATGTGALLGTPTFMAPEQTRGAGDIDERADVYSLGCLLFAMVCGRPPFVYRSVGEMIAAHAKEPPPSPRTFEHEISTQAEREILKALAKHPDHRHQSMLELAVALERLGVPDPLPRSALVAPEAPRPERASTEPRATPRPEASVVSKTVLLPEEPVTLKTVPLPVAKFPARVSVGAAGVLSLEAPDTVRDLPALGQISILLSASLPRLVDVDVVDERPISEPGGTRQLPHVVPPARLLTPRIGPPSTFSDTISEVIVRARRLTRSNTAMAAAALVFLIVAAAALWKAIAHLRSSPLDHVRVVAVEPVAPPLPVVPPAPPIVRVGPPSSPAPPIQVTQLPAPIQAIAPPPSEPPDSAPPGSGARDRLLGDDVLASAPLQGQRSRPRPRRPRIEGGHDADDSDYVEISVRNPEPGLVVSVDGDEATLPVRLFRDREAHTLRFFAPGRRPETRIVRATQSHDLTLANQPALILE